MVDSSDMVIKIGIVDCTFLMVDVGTTISFVEATINVLCFSVVNSCVVASFVSWLVNSSVVNFSVIIAAVVCVWVVNFSVVNSTTVVCCVDGTVVTTVVASNVVRAVVVLGG